MVAVDLPVSLLSTPNMDVRNSECSLVVSRGFIDLTGDSCREGILS